MDYPKSLTSSDWDKKKGTIAKSHPTGIGDALKALEKMHKTVDWSRYEPDDWAKVSTNIQAFDLVMADRLKEFQTKVLPIAGQAETVGTLADKWVVKFTKDKLVPKSATQAAQGIAGAASTYAGDIKQLVQKIQSSAKSVRAKLPTSDEGEEGDSKLFDPKALASSLARLKRDIKLSAEFGFTPQNKDQPPILLLSFRINAKLLLAKIKDEKGGTAGAYGEAYCDKDGNLLLKVDKMASGIVKGVRAATKAAGVKFKSIQLLDPKGTKLESDDEAEDDDVPPKKEGGDKDKLLEIKTALEKLSSKLDVAVKTAGEKRRAALLETVKQLQESVKKEDIERAGKLLTELAKLIEAKDEPPTTKSESSSTPSSKPVPPTLDLKGGYANLKKNLAEALKAALLLSAHGKRIKSLFDQAELESKNGQDGQALKSLATLQDALAEIARQREECDKVAKTVLQAIDEALKTVSPKNKERLTRAKQAAQLLHQAGDYEKAQAALVEAGKLVVAIRKESTPSGGVGDDEAEDTGKFMQDMNDEADWNRESATLADVRTKLGDLKTWNDPEHTELAKALKAAEDAAGGRRFTEAVELLTALAPKVRKLHGEHPLRGRWLALKPRLDAAGLKLDNLQKDGAPEVPALRYDFKFVREEAARAQYQKALDRFDILEPKIEDLTNAYADPERKRWAKMDLDYLSVKSKLEAAQEHLDGLGQDTTPADDLIVELNDIRLLARNDEFGKACKKLATLKPKVDKLETRTAALGVHAVELGRLQARLEPAWCVVRGGEPKAAVKTFVDADAAMSAANKVDKADKLAGLRAALLQAASKLMSAYESSGPDPTDATAQELAYRKFMQSTYQPQWDQIKALKLYTGALRKLRNEYGDLYVEADNHAQADDWKDALDSARKMVTKGQQLLRAHRQADRAAKSFHARYSKSRNAILGLYNWLNTLPVLTKEQQAFKDAAEEIGDEEDKPAANYTLCHKLLTTKLEPALKTLVDQRKQSMHNEVQTLGSSNDAGNLVDGKEPWELEIMDPADQTALLRKLREDWANVAPTPQQREQQRKIYLATKMDESFLEHEGERRKQLIDAFKGDKEMKQASKDWKNTDWEKRRALLQRIANQQCKAFGFDPVPEIKLVDLGGSEMSVTNGYFDPTTKAIVLNVSPASSANDFERAVDLIVHENSHYYQDQLCTGMIDPGKRDKRLDTQVDLFKANDDGGGYVTGSEDFKTYQHQPLEEHAHFAGPETATGILANMQQEDEGVDLSGLTRLG